jgi:hypothetical protein
MEHGQSLGPYGERRSWRAIRRLRRLIDPTSETALSDLDFSLRVRIPKDSHKARRLVAEALDSFHEKLISFPALIRGLAGGEEIERLVAVDNHGSLALRDRRLAIELGEARSIDTDGTIADRARHELEWIDRQASPIRTRADVSMSIVC